MRWIDADAESSSPSTDIGAAKAIRSTSALGYCSPVPTSSPIARSTVTLICSPLRTAVIGSISTGIPKALTEVITLGWTLKNGAAAVLAYFDRPDTSIGPTQAISGRLEHLRGSTLGYRNWTNYIARSQLEIGGSRPQIHLRL